MVSPWQAVDINALAREHLPRYGEELLSPDNLRNLALTPDADWGEYIRQEYRRARRALQTGRGSGIWFDGRQYRRRRPCGKKFWRTEWVDWLNNG